MGKEKNETIESCVFCRAHHTFCEGDLIAYCGGAQTPVHHWALLIREETTGESNLEFTLKESARSLV